MPLLHWIFYHVKYLYLTTLWYKRVYGHNRTLLIFLVSIFLMIATALMSYLALAIYLHILLIELIFLITSYLFFQEIVHSEVPSKLRCNLIDIPQIEITIAKLKYHL